MKSFANNIYSSILLIIAFASGGCSKTDGPQNLEPEITLLDAYDITRTEATLSAKIIKHGAGKLSYIFFRYGDKPDMTNRTEEISSPSDIVTIRITDLRPGTTYHFQATGGNGNAHLESGQLSFTTIPNDKPSVSGLEILSSGPTAVIIGFNIIEDGGENIIDAGCYVKDNTTDNEVRHTIDANGIQTGKIRMVLTSLTPLTSYSLTPFATNAIGETKGENIIFSTGNTVSLSSPGDLPEILGKNDSGFSSISISGKMNGTDFRFLRRLLNAPPQPGEDAIISSLNTIDLSDAHIVEGGESFDGSRYTSANTISSGLFANCLNLKEIMIPYSSTQLQRDAFKGCNNLKSLTITPNITNLLPSSDCVNLERIQVTEGNLNYTSIDGVLYNSNATEILWFPQGKSGRFSLPESVTEIMENAFRGTKITTLILPPGLKSIARGAFSESSLQEISMPALLTNISESMFQDCKNLKTVRFGSMTQFFGNYVFDGCPLEDIYMESQLPPYISSDTFTNNTDLFKTCTLHVPSASKKIYRNHQQWGKFDNIVEL